LLHILFLMATSEPTEPPSCFPDGLAIPEPSCGILLKVLGSSPFDVRAWPLTSVPLCCSHLFGTSLTGAVNSGPSSNKLLGTSEEGQNSLVPKGFGDGMRDESLPRLLRPKEGIPLPKSPHS